MNACGVSPRRLWLKQDPPGLSLGDPVLVSDYLATKQFDYLVVTVWLSVVTPATETLTLFLPFFSDTE
jgi:hypothetical protein